MENKKAESLLTGGTHSLVPTLIVLVVSIVFMFVGYYQGEVNSYFQKAVLVCTQCIGIG